MVHDGTKMSVRKAKESDFSQLIILFREFAEYERRAELMVNTEEQMKEQQNFFNCFVVETEQGKIVGYLSYFFCYYTWTGKTIYMDDLYVSPDYRGQNLGRILINKIIELGTQTGCAKLRWQVSKWNTAAIKLYKKIGASIEDIELDCDLMLK